MGKKRKASAGPPSKDAGAALAKNGPLGRDAGAALASGVAPTSAAGSRKDAASKKDAAPKADWLPTVAAFVDRRSWIVFGALILIASLRIVSTYWVFNHTIDEPAHIACGMEWLDKGTYHYETQHPPFARVMTAILPYLSGAHSWDRPLMYNEGAAVLYRGNHYDRTLALARLGILPFFWLGCLVVYLWTRRDFGLTAAFFATLCFTFLPSILAHAGLATTDMALTATFGAAFLAMRVWLEKPTWKWSLVFGVALAATVLSKFSVLVFFPASAGIALIWHLVSARPRFARTMAFVKPRLLPFAMVVGVAGLLIWGGFRFSFGRVPRSAPLGGWMMPAPELFAGIGEVRKHNSLGNPGYLLGEYNETGWWYYYPVVLAVKTPLALLGLVGIGTIVCWTRRKDAGGTAFWMPLAFALGVFLVGAFSRINIGVRHILPVYIAFCILAGVGACWLFSSPNKAARWTLAGLLFWMMASSALSHPDYLAYFNALAGSEPEKILVDSDLDWGQDMKRLSARLKEAGATQVAFDPFIIAYLEAVHGFPPIKPLDPTTPLPGWNAVSLTMLKLDRLGLKRNNPEYVVWPERIPPGERIGKGVLLWYFPPAQQR